MGFWVLSAVLVGTRVHATRVIVKELFMEAQLLAAILVAVTMEMGYLEHIATFRVPHLVMSRFRLGPTVVMAGDFVS